MTPVHTAQRLALNESGRKPQRSHSHSLRNNTHETAQTHFCTKQYVREVKKKGKKKKSLLPNELELEMNGLSQAQERLSGMKR